MMRLFLLVLLIPFFSFGQKMDKDQLVQFSGVIVTADSLKPIPFSSVMIKGSNRGTVSDYYGFFSFVAKMKDSIEFSAIGYKKAIFVIPDTLTDYRCSMIQILRSDTIVLRELVIFPWPTKEQFKEAFLHLRIPDDDLARAEKNLNPNDLAFIAANLPMDGSMNYRNYLGDKSTQLYYSGQYPSYTIFDPLKWSKFIQQWQNGAYKDKTKKKK
jgi:hypothetical protein